MGLFSSSEDNKNYLNSFSKTNESFGKRLFNLINNGSFDKDAFLNDLMVVLIESDFGYNTAKNICDDVSKVLNNNDSKEEVLQKVVDTITQTYNRIEDSPIIFNDNGPTVILMVGVNGSGKTSTCAKLANTFIKAGKSVALVAADTFRAGARDQLVKWAEQLNIKCITGKDNQDPSSVLVDGCIYAKENNIDILLCDTAGRLQNKANLMIELEKMNRVVGKQIEGAPHNCFLVLDSNTGQNGLSQAELFSSVTDLNGIILTKIDGTSKGGIIIAIKNITHVPVRFITFGEDMDSISEFNLELYIKGIIKELYD